MKTIIMLICLTAAVTEAFAGDCKNKVALFLNQPNYENYLALNRNDTSENSDVCWLDLKIDVDNLASLYGHARQGNTWAIKILIKHTSDLDGGELEDAYIALGESIDREPRILLREFKEKRMTENQFKQALVMLPLSLTDNEKGEVAALKARKSKIHSIKDSSLKQQKELAEKVINSRIRRITEE
jgi:hypothetical protein